MRGSLLGVAATAWLLGLASCGHSTASEACTTGGACTCTDGTSGTQVCRPDGSLAACTCSAGSGACPPARSQEYCDGLDNDCNGIVDDGEVCPDPAVANTTPFTGGVYFHGDAGNGFCGSDEVQRFWPTLSTTPFAGFDCRTSGYRFRRSDAALFYQFTFTGILQRTSPTDTVMATPPCDATVREHFDFDASNTLYYLCGDAVFKTGGVMVAQPVLDLAAVLDDGRVIATRAGAAGAIDYVVLDGAGNELSRLSPSATFAGTLTPVLGAATVAGNRGYVVYRREYAIRQTEIVVFRVDEHSTWARVRRVSVPQFGDSQLALSDGTVYINERDPDNFEESTQRIIAFLPDGTSQPVWHEYDVGSIRSKFDDQMLVGPP